AKRLLEDASGRHVIGYRAPSYSITPQSLWALDVLLEEGYRYDSSIFPIRHDRYGIPLSARLPYAIQRDAGTLIEVPASTARVGPLTVPRAGGRCGGRRWLLPHPAVLVDAVGHRPREPARGAGGDLLPPSMGNRSGSAETESRCAQPLPTLSQPERNRGPASRAPQGFQVRDRRIGHREHAGLRRRSGRPGAPLPLVDTMLVLEGSRQPDVDSLAVSPDIAPAVWDAYVASNPEATGYHRSMWRGVFERALGHETVYLAAMRGTRVVGVLPLVAVRSWIFGSALVSLPFLNYGGVLADDRAAADALVDRARAAARGGGGAVAPRGGAPPPPAPLSGPPRGHPQSRETARVPRR